MQIRANQNPSGRGQKSYIGQFSASANQNQCYNWTPIGYHGSTFAYDSDPRWQKRPHFQTFLSRSNCKFLLKKTKSVHAGVQDLWGLIFLGTALAWAVSMDAWVWLPPGQGSSSAWPPASKQHGSSKEAGHWEGSNKTLILQSWLPISKRKWNLKWESRYDDVNYNFSSPVKCLFCLEWGSWKPLHFVQDTIQSTTFQ